MLRTGLDESCGRLGYSVFATAMASVTLFGCDSPLLRTLEERLPANDTPENCKPAPPQNLRVVPEGPTLALSWELPDLTQDGVIVQRLGVEAGFGEIARLPPGSTRMNDAAVSLDRSYSYRVASYRVLGTEQCDGDFTEPVEALTVPRPLTGVTAEFTGGALLSWTNPNTTSQDVLIERSIDDGPWTSVTVSDSSYFDDVQGLGGTVRYRIAASNASGTSDVEERELQIPTAPTVSWAGGFELGDACYLQMPTSVAYADDGTFASATSDSTRANGPVSASEGEFSIQITDFAEGPMSVAWTVQDTNGAAAVLEREFTISRELSTRTEPKIPNRGNWLTGNGIQAINSSCQDCEGHRAVMKGGPYHRCYIDEDQTVNCFGYNALGQLGIGNPQTPRPGFPAVCLDEACTQSLTANEVFTGYESVCATLGANDALWCWGEYTDGAIPRGDFSGEAPRPVVACANDGTDGCAPLTGIADVDSYRHSRCAATTTGEVYCWGDNEDNKFFVDPTTDNVYLARRVCLTGSDATGDCVPLTGATSVTVGQYHQCALMNDDTIRCWGWNYYGQLGIGFEGGFSEYFPPVPVCANGVQYNDGTGQCGASDERLLAKQVEANYRGTCALLSNDSVQCWGYNNYGTVGDGTYTDRATPVPVCLEDGAGDGTSCPGPALTGVAQLSVDHNTVCARFADETAVCWGDGSDGQLGNGGFPSFQNNPTPVCASGASDETTPCLDEAAPSGLGEIKEIAVERFRTCVIVGASGEVQCFGDGQLNNPTLGRTYSALPVPTCTDVVDGVCEPLTGQTRIALGYFTACTQDSTGLVRCFGEEALSNEVLEFYAIPVKVCQEGNLFDGCVPVSGVVDLALGSASTCMLLDTGQVRCMGWNYRAALGNGMSTDSFSDSEILPPQGLCEAGVFDGEGGCELSSIRIGDEMAGFVQIDGYGVIQDRSSPVPFGAEGERFCAVHESGRVYCWGRNLSLGIGLGTGSSFEDLANPQPVLCSAVGPGCSSVGAIMDGMVNVAVGRRHACAIHETGVVRCWGDNQYGQLGKGDVADTDGGSVEAILPVPATQLALGYDHSCAVGLDSRVYCWGYSSNTYASLGYIADRDNPVPRPVCAGDPSECVPLEGAVSVSAYRDTYCILRDDGTPWCYGKSLYGVLGDNAWGELAVAEGARPVCGHVETCTELKETPEGDYDYSCDVPFDSQLINLSVTRFSVCGTDVNGALQCWGTGTRGNGTVLREYPDEACSVGPVCALGDFSCAANEEAVAMKSCNLVRLTEN